MIPSRFGHDFPVIAKEGSLELGIEVSRKLRQVLGPLLGAAIMAYFTFHALQGERGLIAWWNLRYDIERVDAQLARVATEKKNLEHKVSLLRPENLDRDMLEERARLMLGAVHPSDIIVPEPSVFDDATDF